MTDPATSVADRVREVFVIFGKSEDLTATLAESAECLSSDERQVALAFLESLRGIHQTLSIPFTYTYSQVTALHWQRFLMAERIRARSLDDESAREGAARAAAKAAFEDFLAKEVGGTVADQVLNQLASLLDQPESLSAGRELARQGVVLTWSAFEVFARDMFVSLLNRNPTLVERLQAHPRGRKRFIVEKVDWETLSRFDFDLSESLGTLLSQRSDLDDILTIRDAYEALYPSATALRERLADKRLWHLFQNRNLIVHRRGIVDQQYVEKTGTTLPMGSPLWVAPSEIEKYIEAAISAGTELVKEISNAGEPIIPPDAAR